MDDSRIIRMFFDRAEGAIDALERKLGKLLYQLAVNILEDPREAEECVSDTSLAVWNAIPPEKPNLLTPYVCRIARNIALKRLRENTALRRNSRFDLSLEELTDCIPDRTAEEALQSRELGRCLNRFLSTLSEENRLLFLRRYWFGDSLQDIAGLTGLRENTIAVRLSRIRAALKDYLIQEGSYETQ